MLVDSHCHLYKEYYNDLSEIINDAKKVGVNRYIVSGCDQKSNEETILLTKEYKEIYGCIGIHPENVDCFKSEDIEFLESHLKDKKILAIGEIGLDYHYSNDNKDKQKELFELQMELASKYHLPVVIHSRCATEDTINILRKYPSVKGVIHSFSLPIEVARIYIKMGYKLGINGVVTFKNSNLKEIISEIFPFIILETDSPYLTPHPFRGTQNSPKYIANIAEFLSELLAKDRREIEEVTTNNVQEIFEVTL